MAGKINFRRSSPEFKELREKQANGQAYEEYQLERAQALKVTAFKRTVRKVYGKNPDGSRWMPYTKRRARVSGAAPVYLPQ